MSSASRQPFIDSRAFDKANSTHVPFPSQADAMLASLQLFHDVPCRIMDLIFSVVTHSDFDSKQVTLRNSVDVIDVVEDCRLKDRMSVVHKRSHGDDGHIEQAGFPQFILDEVLDIIHVKRMYSIKARFEEALDEEAMFDKSMHIEEDDTLKAMTVVHRSWTTLAQKALGRVLHIGRPTREMNIFLYPVRKSIFGPWTSVVAVQFYHPITPTTEFCEDTYCVYSTDVDASDEYRDWFENMHRILVGFTNIKCLYIKSYASLFSRWSNLTFGDMVRRNARLEEITVYAVDDEAFDLDPLFENTAVLKNLRTLNIEGAQTSYVAEGNATLGQSFTCLNNVTIRPSSRSFIHDWALLSILSSRSNSRLESLQIIDTCRFRGAFYERKAQAFTPSQCVAIFENLRSLHIDSKAADLWFKCIGSYCSRLESLSIIGGTDRRQFFEEEVRRESSSLQIDIAFDRLRTLRIESLEAADLWLGWIGPFCSGLQSLRLFINVSRTPEILDLFPTTIHSLDLVLGTRFNATINEDTAWMKCLLKKVSSKKFSKLESFTLSLSEDCKRYLVPRRSYKQDVRSLRKEMQNFKEEMTTVCKEAGVKCYLDF